MARISSPVQRALFDSPEYEMLSSHLSPLLLSYPPPFIFVHDHQNQRLTAQLVRSILDNLVNEHSDAFNLTWACVDAVACFSSRILFDTALNTLAGWSPDWHDSAQNWLPSTGGEGQRYNENIDAFVHGIQAISIDALNSKSTVVGKGKEPAGRHLHPSYSRMILLIERAERLKDNLPDLIVPLARLAEMSQAAAITTIFISDVHWQDIRPPMRTAPEPYYIDMPNLSKQVTLDLLSLSFLPHSPEASTSQVADADAYHPALEPLYTHFVATLYSICSPFTHDPLELAYIAAARWPGFVQPVLDAHRRSSDAEGKDRSDPGKLLSPNEDVRLRLTRLFTPSLTAALESLHPRMCSALQWAKTHAPPPNLLEVPSGLARDALNAQNADNTHDLHMNTHLRVSESGVDAFPRMAKFVLVAAFLASTNPARSDLRMFGRGPDERARRRRRKVGTPRKPKPGMTVAAMKLPQRLLGHTTFPLDRLIAILGVLLEENDAMVRPVASQYTLPGEYTEMEIARVSVYANIMELASMQLLVRVSPAERLDGTPTFKCGIGHELAVKLARSVGIILNDLMYEAV